MKQVDVDVLWRVLSGKQFRIDPVDCIMQSQIPKFCTQL